jgi:hypothetical protein
VASNGTHVCAEMLDSTLEVSSLIGLHRQHRVVLSSDRHKGDRSKNRTEDTHRPVGLWQGASAARSATWHLTIITFDVNPSI